MFKRVIVIVTVLAVFALSMLGAYTLGAQASSVAAEGQAATVTQAAGFILVSDEPVCPPSVPAPCG